MGIVVIGVEDGNDRNNKEDGMYKSYGDVGEVDRKREMLVVMNVKVKTSVRDYVNGYG